MSLGEEAASGDVFAITIRDAFSTPPIHTWICEYA